MFISFCCYGSKEPLRWQANYPLGNYPLGQLPSRTTTPGATTHQDNYPPRTITPVGQLPRETTTPKDNYPHNLNCTTFADWELGASILGLLEFFINILLHLVRARLVKPVFFSASLLLKFIIFFDFLMIRLNILN